VSNNKISEDELVGHAGLTGDGIDGSGERLLCMHSKNGIVVLTNTFVI